MLPAADQRRSTCFAGARSNLMSAVLEKLGYETRIIALFDTDDEGLRSHTFLEVRNPETGRWETQDPDFDLYWISKSSGLRVSLAEAAEDLSKQNLATAPLRAGGR
jgi:hypothetical protein